MSVGDGSKSVTLNISLLAPPGSSEYCGLLANNVSIAKIINIWFEKKIKNHAKNLEECLSKNV